MITPEKAQQFAREWIEAWNSHDLGRILAHCSDDIALTTPYIVETLKVPSGALKGKSAVKQHWDLALKRIPELHYELIEALPGARSIVILYRTLFDMHAAEWMLFGEDGKIKRSIVHQG